MTWHEVSYATKIDDRINENLYLQILKDELLNTICGKHPSTHWMRIEDS